MHPSTFAAAWVATFALVAFAQGANAGPLTREQSDQDAQTLRSAMTRGPEAFNQTLSKMREKYAARSAVDQLYIFGPLLQTASHAPDASRPEIGDALNRAVRELLVAPISDDAVPLVFQGKLTIFAGRVAGCHIFQPAEADVLLGIWTSLLARVNQFSEFSPGSPKLLLEPFDTPPSYQQEFFFGMSPKAITDPKVRNDYEDYLAARDRLTGGAGNYLVWNRVRVKYEPMVIEYLAKTYGESPERSAALRRLVREKITDAEAAKALLAAVEAKIVRKEPLARRIAEVTFEMPNAELLQLLADVRGFMYAELYRPTLDETGQASFRLLLQLLAKVDALLDPALLVALPKRINIAPPGGTDPAGVVPEAVGDRQVRIYYNRALREDPTWGAVYGRHADLATTKDILLNQVATFVQRHKEADGKFLRNAIQEEISDPALRQRIQQRIAEVGEAN